jgi:hypothetical protein
MCGKWICAVDALSRLLSTGALDCTQHNTLGPTGGGRVAVAIHACPEEGLQGMEPVKKVLVLLPAGDRLD